MRDAWIRWRRIQQRVINSSGRHRSLHLIIDFNDYALCPKFAILFVVFTVRNRKRVENVFNSVARRGEACTKIHPLLRPLNVGFQPASRCIGLKI
jgi:hypothetical protein